MDFVFIVFIICTFLGLKQWWNYKIRLKAIEAAKQLYCDRPLALPEPPQDPKEVPNELAEAYVEVNKEFPDK